MNNDIKLNPCVPCMRKHDPCDINSINNCCYNICAGYIGSSKYPEIINSHCAKMCQQCVNKSTQLNGKAPCYWRNFDKPVIYTQVPHYFPEYFNQTKNKNQALAMCKNACNSSSHPGECCEQCQLDADALMIDNGIGGVPYSGESYTYSNSWCNIL